MGASRSNQRLRTGRICDPVFLCMVGAIVLAVASSVTLRAVMAGAGQLKDDAENQADAAPPRRVVIPPHKSVARHAPGDVATP